MRLEQDPVPNKKSSLSFKKREPPKIAKQSTSTNLLKVPNLAEIQSGIKNLRQTKRDISSG
jgi:hypothetical protein